MRLTRRGWTVVGVGVVGTVMAALFGARSLNAVVFPCLVALVAAVVQIYRIDPPTVDRATPGGGFPGDTETVTLRFETDSPFTATVSDALPPSIDGEARADTTVGRDPVSYDVTYRHRGVHTLGPVSFVATDVLGLAERRFSVAATDDVLVYPQVHALSPRARRDLVALHDSTESHDRDEFDRLRQYVRGDSLRDVHWKSSAKREDLDLVVKEFSADNHSRTLTLALSAEEGCADGMADAGASVALALLRAGVPVELHTPGGTVSAAPGDHVGVLDHLARVGHGRPTADDEAAVAIHATRRGTRIRLGDTTADAGVDFDRLTDSRTRTDADRVGDAPDTTDAVEGANVTDREGVAA